METPKEYKKNIANGIVTPDMLGSCTYSVNKRAKNKRDNIRELKRRCWQNRRNYIYCDAIDKSIAREEDSMYDYYDMKDYFLSLLQPEKIHHMRYPKYDRYGEEIIAVTDMYFWSYRVGDYSFHHPITESEIKNYDLVIEDLPDSFETFGEDIEDLISVPFCKKVKAGLKNGSLKLVA